MADESPVSAQLLLDGLTACVEALRRHQVQYALIGGLAASYRSQPRFTKDVDFLLQVPQLVLPLLLETLARDGFEFDMQATIQEWTQHHMAVLAYHGLRIDWLKPVIPAYQHVLERATEETWLQRHIRIASTEGIILIKLLANRPQDLVDIDNLVAAHRDHLDLDWIRSEWQAIAGLDDPRLVRFLGLAAGASRA